MNKREKVLLQILIAVGVVGVLAVYLLLPAIKKNRTLKQEHEDLVMLQEDMDILLTTPGLYESMEESKQSTEDTYEFFNKDFVVYSVDSVINKLVDQDNLEINSLRIEKYIPRRESEIADMSEYEEDADADTDEEDDDDAEDFYDEEDGPAGFLLGLDVNVAVEGYYEDILKFIDDLNATSKCVNIKECSYSRVEQYNPYESEEEKELHKDEEINYVTANINMTIYSMKPYEGGE